MGTFPVQDSRINGIEGRPTKEMERIVGMPPGAFAVGAATKRSTLKLRLLLSLICIHVPRPKPLRSTEIYPFFLKRDIYFICTQLLFLSAQTHQSNPHRLYPIKVLTPRGEGEGKSVTNELHLRVFQGAYINVDSFLK